MKMFMKTDVKARVFCWRSLLPAVSFDRLLKQLSLSGLTVAMSNVVFAGPLNPSGDYSQAQLHWSPKFRSTVIVSGGLAVSVNLSPSSSIAPVSGSRSGSSGVSPSGLQAGLQAGLQLDRRMAREQRIRLSTYALDERMQKIMDERLIYPFSSPGILGDEDHQRLASIVTGRASGLNNLNDFARVPKGEVSRAELDAVVTRLLPESDEKLVLHKPLTAEETRFLSGLLLYQNSDKCAPAVGIFQKLSKAKGWEAESKYYLAMCSRKLGLETDFYERAAQILETQDAHYSRLILSEMAYDLPYEFTERIGEALVKIVQAPQLRSRVLTLNPSDPMSRVSGNIAYYIAQYGSGTERFKLALEWARKVPADHPRFLAARFLEALSEYQAGAKSKALQIQEELISDVKTERAQNEFQALVALNVARMYFQEKDFKKAQIAFLMVGKDHPLWLQSLTELGWSQLLAGDYEGAIGNMYSMQSPFFSNVYKADSYVIRTIGYLNLCQYGDAYRSLSRLEKEYRPYLDKISQFMAAKLSHYQAVGDYLRAPAGTKEVAGLPVMVIREMARQRDFTNLQKGLNRQIDERGIYAQLSSQVEEQLGAVRKAVTHSRRQSELLRDEIARLPMNAEREQQRKNLNQQLQRELAILNRHFFQIDLFNEAKTAMSDYSRDVTANADSRMSSMKKRLEQVLVKRLSQIKNDLALALENNELLRYEVFAGSGENIRYQVAGGEAANRLPASVIPKSKSLQWDFDGEYWEDEIGHYRSSLKNNCPESSYRQQASLGGNQ